MPIMMRVLSDSGKHEGFATQHLDPVCYQKGLCMSAFVAIAKLNDRCEADSGSITGNALAVVRVGCSLSYPPLKYSISG